MKSDYKEKKPVVDSSLVHSAMELMMELKWECEEKKPAFDSSLICTAKGGKLECKENKMVCDYSLNGKAMEMPLEYEEKKPVFSSSLASGAMEKMLEYEDKKPVFNSKAAFLDVKDLVDAFGTEKTRSYSPKIDMEHQAEKPAVVLTGTAAARVGPALGTVDIGKSESAYLFRVALPGVHQRDLKVNVRKDGRVNITGMVRDYSELNFKSGYEMKIQQLCPSEPFSVTFNLPGPVDPRLCNFDFRPDGILEVVVKAKMG